MFVYVFTITISIPVQYSHVVYILQMFSCRRDKQPEAGFLPNPVE